MGNKFSKYLGYTFLACIVLYFVLNSADVTVNPWVPTVKSASIMLSSSFGSWGMSPLSRTTTVLLMQKSLMTKNKK